MNANKTRVKWIGLSLVLSFLILGGCTFYRTLQVVPVNKASIASTYLFKYIVIVHNNSNKSEFILNNMIVESDFIEGEIFLAHPGKKHKPHTRSFTKSSVKAYNAMTTMHLYTRLDTINPGPIKIPISDIKSIETHEKNVGASVAATTGIVIVSVAVVAGGVTLIVCNCPQVESISDGDSKIHGSLFPGSIFKSLQRHDYVMLGDYLLTNDEELKIRVSNNLPEIQYIDQLEVLEVDHQGFAFLGLNNENKLVAFNKAIPPSTAIESPSKDVKSQLEVEDEFSYSFDQYDSFDQLNAITLQFEKSNVQENPILVINGKQTTWLDTIGNFVFSKMGKSHEEWVNKRDNASPNKWKTNRVKNGMALNVYLKKNDKWEYVSSFQDAGTLNKRNLVMPINTKGITSPVIEIKLESAYKVWEIDYVGLASDWSANLNSMPLEVVSVTNQDGEDVFQKIKQIEGQYLIQNEGNKYVDLLVKNPTTHSKSKTIVLHGYGYYHYRFKDSEEKADLSFFTNLKKQNGLQDVSRALYQYKRMLSDSVNVKLTLATE